jgi:hypothetical protein
MSQLSRAGVVSAFGAHDCVGVVSMYRLRVHSGDIPGPEAVGVRGMAGCHAADGGVLPTVHLGSGLGLRGMFALLFVIVFLCEQIVLIERRAFTCQACGYDLQGLSERRCPECGTDFDPDEQARIQTRIDLPPPRPRRLVLLLLIFGLLTTSVLFGMRAWSRASRPPGAVPATASPAGNPAPLNAP